MRADRGIHLDGYLVVANQLSIRTATHTRVTTHSLQLEPEDKAIDDEQRKGEGMGGSDE